MTSRVRNNNFQGVSYLEKLLFFSSSDLSFEIQGVLGADQAFRHSAAGGLNSQKSLLDSQKAWQKACRGPSFLAEAAHHSLRPEAGEHFIEESHQERHQSGNAL